MWWGGGSVLKIFLNEYHRILVNISKLLLYLGKHYTPISSFPALLAAELVSWSKHSSSFRLFSLLHASGPVASSDLNLGKDNNTEAGEMWAED